MPLLAKIKCATIVYQNIVSNFATPMLTWGGGVKLFLNSPNWTVITYFLSMVNMMVSLCFVRIDNYIL